jgi:hypothetical protein
MLGQNSIERESSDREADNCDRPHVIGWYRSPWWSAHLTFLKVFATFNLIIVLVSILIDGAAQFERAFWIGLAAAGVITPAFQIFRLNPKVGQ